MSRAMTQEEMREAFFQQIAVYFKYWRDLPNPYHNGEVSDTHARMEGFLFSMFNIFDGSTLNCPALDIIPAPHDTDEQWYKNEGVNWWTKEVINDTQLHEIFPWETLK